MNKHHPLEEMTIIKAPALDLAADVYSRRSAQWQQACRLDEVSRYVKGKILISIKSELTKSEVVRFHKEHDIERREAHRLTAWTELMDAQTVADSATVEAHISPYAGRSLATAPPELQTAIIEDVTTNQVTYTAAEIDDLKHRLAVAEASAQELAEMHEAQANQLDQATADRNLQAQKASRLIQEHHALTEELSKLKKEQKKKEDEDKDPEVYRRNMARRHEAAMTMDGGSRRQELTRYFEYRNLYTDEGRQMMDRVIKNLFQTFKANLNSEGDFIE